MDDGAICFAITLIGGVAAVVAYLIMDGEDG